ncbi:MAG: ATP-dependent DNA helicase RecQ, partial [Rhodobacterales bacterium 17-64-5]
IDILTGTATPKVVERGHDQLPTFAVGRELSKPAWAAVFRQMMGRDLVRPDPDRFGALWMTDAALPILKGQESITLRADTVEGAPRSDRSTARAQVDEEDVALLTALKARRRDLAQAQGVPAYVVFPDKTLIEMAEKRPRTLDQMIGINGIGARKLESYGRAFLEVILGGAVDSAPPARRKLAGRDAAPIYDRLEEAQVALSRGENGLGKYLSCTPSTLKQIAENRPSTLSDLYNLHGMGEARTERFGAAFLDILREG